MIQAPVECRVITAHGHDIESVFTALQKKKSAATTLPHCLSAGSRQGFLVPVQMGIISTLPTTTNPVERIFALLKDTLVPLLEQALSFFNSTTSHDNDITILSNSLLSSGSSGGSSKTLAKQTGFNSDHIRIMIILPAKNSVRYAYCSETMIQDFIHDQLNANTPNAAQYCSISFAHEDEDLITPFLQAQAALQQGGVKRLIFGGVDSFLSVKAIRAFEAEQSIRKEGNPDAPLLAEGAAFISLSTQAPLLAKAIDTEKTVSNIPLSPYWISNRSVRLRAEFDWYESMRQYPGFRDLKELNLQKWAGHLGAAQFPLQMSLGFHWATMQATNAPSLAPIILYNENAKKQLILQKYHCFQHSASARNVFKHERPVSTG